MLGSKHHVCESHTVLHMYTPESTPSALQQCAAPSYTLPRKPHNLIFIHISNYMYVFIYIYISVCLCVCRVPPPWNLPFWYPPSSPSPEDFFRYPPQLHPRPSAADMPRSLALFSCSNPRLPFDLSPFPLKLPEGMSKISGGYHHVWPPLTWKLRENPSNDDFGGWGSYFKWIWHGVLCQIPGE